MLLRKSFVVFVLLFAFTYEALARLNTMPHPDQHGPMTKEEMKKFDKLKMTAGSMDKMKNLHKNTYYQALKAIIGKLGAMLFKEMPRPERNRLLHCLDRIEDRRDMYEAAVCVTRARKRHIRAMTTSPNPHVNGNWRTFLQGFDDTGRLRPYSTTPRTTTMAPSHLSPAHEHHDDRLMSLPHPIAFENQYMKPHFTNSKPKPMPTSTSTVSGFVQEAEAETPSPWASSKTRQQVADESYGQLFHLRNSFVQGDGDDDSTPTSTTTTTTTQKPTTTTKKAPRKPLRRKVIKPKPLRKVSIKPTGQKPVKKRTKFALNSATRLSFQKTAYGRKMYRRVKRDYRLLDNHVDEPAEILFSTRPKPGKFKVVNRESLHKLSTDKEDKTVVTKVVNLIKEFTKNETKEAVKEKIADKQWSSTFDRLMRVRRHINEQKAYPGGKIYEKRMYDLVIDSDEATLTPKERKSTGGIMHDAMKLLFSVTNSDSSGNNSESYRVFSPRFMPLMPLNEGKKAPKTLMSPNILAMYDDEKHNDATNVGNIPGMMRTIGLTQADRDKVMQLLMDVSGTSVHIDEALGLYEKLGMFDEDITGPLMKSTERILGSFKIFEKSLFPGQKQSYDKKGFAFVKRSQIEKLMRDQGVDKDEMDLADLDIYDNMTDAEMEEALWRTVEFIATNKTHLLEPNEHARRKRNLITVGAPIILSPYMFAFQVGASILGPVILSPNIFCPPVLNPSVLSPWVLTPSMFNPFILSPYVFGPFILGPFAFTSFVLTPYLLSPNVLNPYIFTSLVLSPLGLCPDILSPMAIAANVLSPSFLSPPVLNPTVLTASVLSPSWLS